MIELINLAIDITILLVKDYHIRVREESEERERQEGLEKIRKAVSVFSNKLKKI